MQVAAEVFKHHDKLIAPKTGHGIGLAHAGHQPRGHLGQQLIAHVVAQGVVQVLEVIQVNEQQRALGLGALPRNDGTLQAV